MFNNNIIQRLQKKERAAAEQRMGDDPRFWAALAARLQPQQPVMVAKQQMGGYTTPKNLRRQQLDQASDQRGHG